MHILGGTERSKINILNFYFGELEKGDNLKIKQTDEKEITNIRREISHVENKKTIEKYGETKKLILWKYQ